MEEKKTFDDYLVKKIKEEKGKGNHKNESMLSNAREYFKNNPSKSIKKLEENDERKTK